MNEAVSPHPKDLLERVKRCANLPSPPGVAVPVIELARDPEVDLGKLASVVIADPALVAKILRTANSSLYVNHRKSENLRQALALLGLNATMSIALSFSLVSTLRAEQGGALITPCFGSVP